MSVPNQTQNTNSRKPIHEEQVKFLVPRDLKTSLHNLADERHISLSALMRLIASEYVKRYHIP